MVNVTPVLTVIGPVVLPFSFAEQTPKLTRGLPAAARKIASLGLGRLGLTVLSRAGLAGLGLSLGIQGYKALTDD